MSWNPRTEADIQAGLDARDVSESNVLDMKALIGDKDSQRKETAKDLASFAVDGGALLIGVVEHKDTRTFEAVPIALRDAIERIEQIAANRVDPPLVVRPREIPSSEAGVGYVWVDIPASPDAPHMVDGRYYGRGERTNRVLSDADVLRLHQQRRNDRERVLEALENLRSRDPFPGARTNGDAAERPRAQYGHLYLAASPRRAPANIARRLVWEGGHELVQLGREVERDVPTVLKDGVSKLSPYVQPLQRSSAASLTNIGGDDLTTIEGNEKQGFDLRIHTDGSVGIIVTRVSTPAERGGSPRALDSVLLASAWRLLGWVNAVARETGYSGTWDLGVHAAGLFGRRSLVFADPRRYDDNEGLAYDENDYRATTSATRAQLDEPVRAVRALAEPFLRGLGTWQYWTTHIPEPGGPVSQDSAPN